MERIAGKGLQGPLQLGLEDLAVMRPRRQSGTADSAAVEGEVNAGLTGLRADDVVLDCVEGERLAAQGP